MTIKKLLCIVFALVMTLGCVAFAEEDLQAQLDAANARIAELEAQVETYYPFYEAQIAATYGEDGVVWVEDILNQYAYVDSQYAGMGMSLESLGMGAYMKQELVSVAVETGVLLDKEEELGLGVVTEEFIAEAEAAADKVIEEYIGYYMDYTYPDVEEITDEMRAEAIAYWADNGLDKESYVESSKQDAITSAMYEYAVKDVVVTEEDVQAEYEAMVAANKEDYAADPGSYASDLTSGALIAYHPEGFRMVKQVLVQFDENQSALYSQLQTRLSSLNAEKEALAAGEAVEGEQRTAAEIDSDIQACAMEIEALYAQLMPEVEEVIEKFNNGTDIETLIAEHNDDPGMMQGITAETGYAVSEGCTNWDPAFKDAAMSIEEIGQLSAPAYGSYGIYIVYYLSDVVPGEVDLETIRADVEYNALENKRTAAYDAALAQWVEEAGVVYHFENLGI